MREIKFRAWIEPMNKMVYGVGFTGDGGIFDEDGNSWQGVIMQFTNLHDKNGKEIYEGDILNWKGSWLEVRWGVGEFVLFSELFSSFGMPNGGKTGMINARHYMQNSEVIGNVWENPELLKGAK